MRIDVLTLFPEMFESPLNHSILKRAQQKKAKQQQEFLRSLKKGAEVVTGGGVYGKITGLTDTCVTLEIADNVRVKVARQYILGPAGSSGEKKDAPACGSSG